MAAFFPLRPLLIQLPLIEHLLCAKHFHHPLSDEKMEACQVWWCTSVISALR